MRLLDGLEIQELKLRVERQRAGIREHKADLQNNIQNREAVSGGGWCGDVGGVTVELMVSDGGGRHWRAEDRSFFERD